MLELADPLVSLLWTYQAQANNTGKEVVIPWRAINKIITTNGSPAINDQSFGKRYDSEQAQGINILNNIVNGNRDSFDKHGIRLVPDNQSADLVNNQAVADENDTVKQTAMHQLKSKK